MQSMVIQFCSSFDCSLLFDLVGENSIQATGYIEQTVFSSLQACVSVPDL